MTLTDTTQKRSELFHLYNYAILNARITYPLIRALMYMDSRGEIGSTITEVVENTNMKHDWTSQNLKDLVNDGFLIAREVPPSKYHSKKALTMYYTTQKTKTLLFNEVFSKVFPVTVALDGATLTI